MQKPFIFLDFSGVIAKQAVETALLTADFLQIDPELIRTFDSKELYGADLQTYWNAIHDMDSEREYLRHYYAKLLSFLNFNIKDYDIEKLADIRFRLKFDIYPDVIPTLELLKDKYSFSLLTDGRPSRRLLLPQLKLEKYFAPEHIFISREVGAKKPSPILYNKAIQATDCDLETSIYCDDTLDYLV